jgi:FlaG/FlaF family flagellin (archaellin)
MKGVSAVIAIILILMIVVALAALAYTWFTGIFSTLTETTGESVTQTATQMQKQFSLDAAACTAGSLSFTIRNTGTGDLQADQVEAFLDGVDATASNPGGTIAEGTTQSYTATGACSSGQVLRVTIETGLSQSLTLP